MQEKGNGEEIVIPLSLANELMEATVQAQPDKPVQNRSHSTIFSLGTSGDWREVLYNGSWWVVGRHLAYPVRDRDDAQRLRSELSQQHKRS